MRERERGRETQRGEGEEAEEERKKEEGLFKTRTVNEVSDSEEEEEEEERWGSQRNSPSPLAWVLSSIPPYRLPVTALFSPSVSPARGVAPTDLQSSD